MVTLMASPLATMSKASSARSRGKLADLRADVAFHGTKGITPHGLTTPDEDEASVKRAMVRAGQRVMMLAGSSELDRETLVRFAAPEDVDVLITELSGERPPRRRGRCRPRRSR